MKILLIQDVDNLGYAGDIKAVAKGYGRNYLLPYKMAVLATPGAVKQAQIVRKAAEARRARERADAQAIVNQLADIQLLFERRAGETGKLYGSVTSSDIAKEINAQTGIEIDKRKVNLPEPINMLGEYEIKIKLMMDLAAPVKVEVLPVGTILERERLAKKAQEEADAAEAAEIVNIAAQIIAESESSEFEVG
jgi:large subunit ribosomal protein L9